MEDLFLRLYNNAVDFFNSSEWQHFKYTVKIISGTVIALCSIGIIILIKKIAEVIKTFDVFGKVNLKPEMEKMNISQESSEITKAWQRINEYINSENESDWKIAIIEADQILDNILTKANFPGKTFTEKLNQINAAEFPNINEILYAHKIRNNIVHEKNFKLVKDEAKKIIDIYKKTLEDLNAF